MNGILPLNLPPDRYKQEQKMWGGIRAMNKDPDQFNKKYDWLEEFDNWKVGKYDWIKGK